jgi:hypothetical protein
MCGVKAETTFKPQGQKARRSTLQLYELYMALHDAFGKRDTTAAPVSGDERAFADQGYRPMPDHGAFKLKLSRSAEANLALVEHGLVTFTFGNVSQIDRTKAGWWPLSPAGWSYDALKPKNIS